LDVIDCDQTIFCKFAAIHHGDAYAGWGVV